MIPAVIRGIRWSSCNHIDLRVSRNCMKIILEIDEKKETEKEECRREKTELVDGKWMIISFLKCYCMSTRSKTLFLILYLLIISISRIVTIVAFAKILLVFNNSLGEIGGKEERERLSSISVKIRPCVIRVPLENF